jgi:hypothetical protein
LRHPTVIAFGLVEAVAFVDGTPNKCLLRSLCQYPPGLL